MKILAIRLKNLASLAGPFEIDFTAEPLASAGLFGDHRAHRRRQSTLPMPQVPGPVWRGTAAQQHRA